VWTIVWVLTNLVAGVYGRLAAAHPPVHQPRQSTMPLFQETRTTALTTALRRSFLVVTAATTSVDVLRRQKNCRRERPRSPVQRRPVT